jgi:N-acetylglucosamine kinase-like BadF-type ATPase
MSDLYVFEAGATKTNLIFQKEGAKQEIILPGFNPNRVGDEFKNALKSEVVFAENAVVFFYGAGLGNETNKGVVREMFNFLEAGKVRVHDDILGAARAAFKTEAGIICIMGTGGLAAYYDGREIIQRRGGYGYLINDLGGGYELGKRILTAWLNGDLSESVGELLESNSGVNKKMLVETVYENIDLDLIAAIPKVMAEVQDDSILEIINTYFDDFFNENVLPLVKANEVKNFSIIGGLGTGFYKKIREVSSVYDLRLDQCIQSPAQRLFDYHLNNS